MFSLDSDYFSFLGGVRACIAGVDITQSEHFFMVEEGDIVELVYHLDIWISCMIRWIHTREFLHGVCTTKAF